jgi:Kef-type K+ transport system membrane component KefB
MNRIIVCLLFLSLLLMGDTRFFFVQGSPPAHEVQEMVRTGKVDSSEAAHITPTVQHVESSSHDAAGGHHMSFDILAYIAIILVAAKVSGIVERWKQPAVLGELLIGVILGNIVYFGVTVFEPMKQDVILKFLAELGVIVLLFQIGLESNIGQMKKVGMRAFAVAIVGVVVPFVLGTYVVAPFLLPTSSDNARLFLGAVLTATSVGITARVFKDLGKLKTPEAQIVLGAAVIDDVLGLVILAVVSAVVKSGSISPLDVGIILAKAVGFLALAIYLGERYAAKLGRVFSRIHRGTGMKFTITIVMGLGLSYLSYLIGLAPIIGAFAAGLVLDPVHFDDYHEPDAVHEIRKLSKQIENKEIKTHLQDIISHHSHRHIEELVAPLGYFTVPLFFVLTGFQVDLRSFLDPQVLMIAGGVTLAAFIGKVVAGTVAGSVDKILVGVGMIPRGEVGLIFASAGKALGVVDDKLYSAIVVMVILSTLLTPPLLTSLIKKSKA